jgi:hypothetical protein
MSSVCGTIGWGDFGAVSAGGMVSWLSLPPGLGAPLVFCVYILRPARAGGTVFTFRELDSWWNGGL